MHTFDLDDHHNACLRDHTEYLFISTPTLPFSTHWVTMTTLWTFCSQTIFQKSSLVPGRGPCVAMYSLRKLFPCNNIHTRLKGQTSEYQK